VRVEGNGRSGNSGCDFGGVLDWGVTTREDGTTDRRDGTRSAGLILVDVLGTSRVVLDHEVVDLHGEGPLAVVCRTASPGDGTLGVRRITATPCAKFDLHGRLRVLVFGICRLQRSNRFAIDLPYNLCRGPFNGVSLESCLATRVVVKGATVIVCRLTFAWYLLVFET
jgi:hypothetical protein